MPPQTDYPIVGATQEAESARLDEMHNGFANYLDKKLALTSLGDPKTILEIGAGSGAWAIQAAREYPDAEVLAVDINELPPRSLPPNLRFHKVDLTQQLPFESESFDVVHIRFVLVHLPNFQEVLDRIIKLVKPAGWLLIEDMEHQLYDEHNGVGPGVKRLYELCQGYTEARGMDYAAGRKVVGVMMDSYAFSEVAATRVKASVSGKSKDPAANGLGATMKKSLGRSYRQLNEKMILHGFTEEAVDGWQAEVDDPNRDFCAEHRNKLYDYHVEKDTTDQLRATAKDQTGDRDVLRGAERWKHKFKGHWQVLDLVRYFYETGLNASAEN